MARDQIPSANRNAAASLGFWARTGFIQPMVKDHAHADIELNFLFSGGMRYFFGGRFHDLAPGRLAAFWAAIPHQAVSVEPGTEIMWVCVPLAQFLRWDLGASAMRRLLRGEFILDQSSTAWDADQFRSWAADYATGEAFAIRTMTLEVEARMRRLTRVARAAARVAKSRAPDQGASSRVEAIASWLGDHYREELTLAVIGAAVGLHPNYAMSLFRSSCGMTIWKYLTRLRLAHAQRLLATTDRTALAIALDSGFGSLGRFYAAFSGEFGVPPGEFRRLNHG